jgi:hypothetical protein
MTPYVHNTGYDVPDSTPCDHLTREECH